MALKTKLQISRGRLEMIYSVAVLLIIPAALVVNTLWLTHSVQSDFDAELRFKANLANQVAGVQVAGILASGPVAKEQPALQNLVSRIASQSDEIQGVSVSAPGKDGLVVVASSIKNEIGKADTDVQTQLAWDQNVPVAMLTAAVDGGRVWRVITPLSQNGHKVAVMRLDVTLSNADKLLSTTTRNSLIILVVTVLVVLLLLYNHLRFVVYAVSWRKQKELDQLKDDFISVATHELKAPMTVIKGYLSEVLDGSSGEVSKEAHDSLDVAYTQTERLGSLVADLLDVSRIEQGRTKYDMQKVDLPALIGPLAATYQKRAEEKGLGLSYQPAAGLPSVQADPTRVSEIFTNLIDNAVKYSKQGSITVEHEIQGKYLATRVRDQGIGMSADERRRLFERFYRVRNDETADIPGTGLGLWIIKQYAEAMGGRISVDSVPGSGTTFTVSLPIVK